MSKEVRKKTSSKLSLRKTGKGNSENIRTLSIPDHDLNETSEFQQPRPRRAVPVLPCPGSGQTKRLQDAKHRDGQKGQGQTTKGLSDTEHNVLPEENLLKVKEEECRNGIVHDSVIPGDNINIEMKEKEDHTEDRSRCLACGLYFPQVDLSNHIQKCLQSKFNRTTQSGTGRQDKKMDEIKQEVEMDDSYFCLFCRKDLSRLNSKLKTQHLNRCMDKEEKRKNEEEMEKLSLERASKAVLSCPMCGKPFRTENARKIHLKKCALTNGIMTDQILKLVKDQEEERRLNIAAGVIPPEIGKLKTTAGSCTSTTRSRKVKEPKSQFDEDTQLAMAISSSIEDDEREKEAELIGQTLGSEHVAAMNLQVNRGNRRRKQNKKGDGDGMPLLLALSDEEKTRRRELKVGSVLVPLDEEEEELECTPTLKNSELKLQQKEPHLWTRCCLEHKEIKKEEDFYVSSLMPPVEVSKAVLGTKIRKMSEIPGRRRSVSASHNQGEQASHQGELDSDVMVQRDNLIASTQTAIVLAELAASGEEEGELDCSVHCSGFCPEKTIKIKGCIQSEAGRGLQMAMLELVNDQSGSDITIIVQDNQQIYAHSLILNRRCPALLQLEKDSKIELLEVSFDVMLVILKYVYAGHIFLCPSNVDRARALSQRLKLEELAKICEEVISQGSTEIENTSAGYHDNHSDIDTIKNRQSDVDRILSNVWGESGSEDDDPQTCPGSSAEGSPTKGWGNVEEYGETTSPRVQTGSTNKKHSDESEYLGKPTLVVKGLRESLANSTQGPGACGYGNKGDNSERNQEELQQEIDNFFQDDSFDMTCDVQKAETCEVRKAETNGTVTNNNKTIIFEDDEVALFDASESSASSGNVSPTKACGTNFRGRPSTRGKEDSTCRQQMEKEKDKEADIIISSDESDNEVKEDESSVYDFDEKNKTRHLSPQVQQCKTKLLQNSKLTSKSPLSDQEMNVSKEDLINMGSSPMSFRRAEDNSPIQLSPDLIEENVTEDSFLLYSSPSKKRKRAARKSSTKVKSPVVVVVKTPEKMESFHTDTPVSNAETSGLDLFGSPSPCNKRRKTDSPTKLRQDANYSDDRTMFSKISKSLHLSPKLVSPRKLKLDELENNSPTFSRSQKHGTRKDFLSEQQLNSNKPDQQFEFCKSRLDQSPKWNTGKDVLNLSMGVMTSCQTDRQVDDDVVMTSCQMGGQIDDDVEYGGDNLQKMSQGSPIFQAKVKKKWKFTKKNIHTSQTKTNFEKQEAVSLSTDVTGSCTVSPDYQTVSHTVSPDYQTVSHTVSPEQQIVSPTVNPDHQTVSPTGSPDQQAVWIECSPVKLSRENSPVVDITAPDIDPDMSIPRGVWDDFDDSGAGFLGTEDIASATPKGHNFSLNEDVTSGTQKGHHSSPDEDVCEVKINSNIHRSPAMLTPIIPRHPGKPRAYLPDTAPSKDFDDSFVWGEDDDPDVSLHADRKPGGQAKMSFKTPTVSNQRKAATVKQWMPPSPFTPMPQYDSMNTPQLKRAINKIGVRPVGKKRMIALLKDVYDKTHQYETDSDCEEDEDDDDGVSGVTKETEADDLNSSQESSQSDMVEESFMQGSADDLVASQLSQKDDTALSDKLEQFLISRTDIHTRTLMYEPLEVDWLKKEITEAGIKCSMQKLLDFLDEMCITFTMKKMRQERNARRGRGRSSKKGTESSPSKNTSPKKKRASPSKKGSPKKKASKQAKGSPKKRGPKATANSPKKRGPKATAEDPVS